MSRPPGDAVYAFVGWFLLAFVPVTVLLDPLAPALADGRAPLLLAGVVALPFAVAHWYAGRSVGPLGATVFWSAALAVGVGLPLLFVSRVAGVGEWFDSPAVRLAGLCVVYAAAFGLAARRPSRPGSTA